MTFTAIERAYLSAHPLGRLASLGPLGSPHIHPVAFWLNTDTGTVNIGGPALRRSQKFRNVLADRGASRRRPRPDAPRPEPRNAAPVIGFYRIGP